MRLIDADALDAAFTDLRFNTDRTMKHWGDRQDWCLHGSEVEKLIENAPTVSGWVSVKDRLPEHGKRYLIYATSGDNKNGHITTAAFSGHFALSGRCAYWKVTHWMPLPELPEEDEKHG